MIQSLEARKMFTCVIMCAIYIYIQNMSLCVRLWEINIFKWHIIQKTKNYFVIICMVHMNTKHILYVPGKHTYTHVP